MIVLSQIVPEGSIDEALINSSYSLNASGVSLQEKLYRGLERCLQDSLCLCNVIPIGSWPKYSSVFKIPSFCFELGSASGINVGFLNLFGCKHHSIQKSLIKELKRLLGSEKHEQLLVYAPNTYSLEAACTVKRQYPNLSLSLIVPDLPEFGILAERPSLKDAVYSSLANRSFVKALNCFDAMIFLTEQMAEYLNWSKPYLVVEGVADSVDVGNCLEYESREKIIVYTGTTHTRFGAKHLVEAFSYVSDPDARLVICGCGDADEYIREKSLIDRRIQHMGVVSHARALELQSQAFVLVNPRRNDGDFTKYSFPSKTMEYLATGVPTVAYLLDGMPHDYSNFIIAPDDDSAKSLGEALSKVLSMEKTDWSSIGESAKQFVLLNKNPIKQAKRIVDFLDSV